MSTLSDKAQSFLERNPEHLGTVMGYSFYEHPGQGDDYPLMMITPDGKKKLYDGYDVPSRIELAEFLNN